MQARLVAALETEWEPSSELLHVERLSDKQRRCGACGRLHVLTLRAGSGPLSDRGHQLVAWFVVHHCPGHVPFGRWWWRRVDRPRAIERQHVWEACGKRIGRSPNVNYVTTAYTVRVE
eukprot:747219-Prymnesium_polylepis.2